MLLPAHLIAADLMCFFNFSEAISLFTGSVILCLCLHISLGHGSMMVPATSMIGLVSLSIVFQHE